jgi:hypothetical protein
VIRLDVSGYQDKATTAEALHPRATQVTDESEVDVVLCAWIPAGSLSRSTDEVVEVRKGIVEGGCRGCAQ